MLLKIKIILFNNTQYRMKNTQVTWFGTPEIDLKKQRVALYHEAFPSIGNQCTINVSVAFEKCGVEVGKWGIQLCSLAKVDESHKNHAIRAEELVQVCQITLFSLPYASLKGRTLCS